MPTLKKQTFAKANRTVTPASKNHGVLSQMNDEDLMSQFQMGTVEAFDILVSRYHDPLTNYIYRFLGDLKECEDLLQETFLRVYRNRHSYRRIAKFSTWLYTIAGKRLPVTAASRATSPQAVLRATTRLPASPRRGSRKI